MLRENEYYLKDICLIKGGKRLPKGHQLIKTITNHPYIKARDIRNRKIDLSNLEFIKEETFHRIKRYIVSTSDVCITIVGANIGDTGIVPEKLNSANLTENAVRLTKFKDSCFPTYISYILSTQSYKSYMELVAAGAAQPKLGLYKIQKIVVSLPAYSIQKHISEFLLAYDDLIEVNNQRINLLEKMANQLYKEWFVRMRFPGHEQVVFEKGIPKNWKIVPIGKIITYNIGGGWGSEKQTNQFSVSGYVIRGTDIPKIRNGEINKEVYRFHKHSNMKSRELKEGDIVFETAGGSEGQLLGRTCFITQEVLDAYGDKVMAASFCKQIRTTSIPSLYLFYFLNSLYESGIIETFQVQSTGISNYQFEPFLKFQQIILPTDELTKSFHENVMPLQKQITTLGQQNNHLRQIRDRLLPRFISGKLQAKTQKETAVDLQD